MSIHRTPPHTDNSVLPQPFRVHHRRWMVALAAMAAAVAAWTVAVPIADVDLAVQQGDTVRNIGHLAVTLSSLAAGLAGWGLLVVLERWAPSPTPLWRIVAVTVFLGSLLVGPMSAVSTSAAGVLIGLHSIVAGILIWGRPKVSDIRVADMATR